MENPEAPLTSNAELTRVNDPSSVAPTYLSIVGTVDRDGHVEIQPGFVTQSPETSRWAADSGSNGLLVVECISDSGEVLSRHHLPVAPLCVYAGPAHGLGLFAAKIPFLEEVRGIRIQRFQKTLLELRRQDHPPRVRFDWKPASTMVGIASIKWSARWSDDTPVHFMLLYSFDDGREWQPLTLCSERKGVDINFDELPGGERCRLKILVSDGMNTSNAISPHFAVPRKGYRALIMMPADGSVFRAGHVACFMGQGVHIEERRAELDALEWTSSIDGGLGRGAFLETRLSPGLHEIGLIVGKGPERGMGHISITVSEGARPALRPSPGKNEDG